MLYSYVLKVEYEDELYENKNIFLSFLQSWALGMLLMFFLCFFLCFSFAFFFF